MMRRNWFLMTVALVLAFAVPSARAHRLDEYLQAALVEVKRSELTVQLYLTPGVEVFDRVMLVIDRDGDGQISPDEATAYGQALLADLSVGLDDKPLKLELVRTAFDPVVELKNGTGNIVVEFRATAGQLLSGEHLLAFENHHQSKMSVYLLNAVLPKDAAIRIVKQERNRNQSSGRIRFEVAK